MRTLALAVPCAVLALALAAAPARAGSKGYSVEAAAGVSAGPSSVNTTSGGSPYHPFTDFGKDLPESTPGRPVQRLAPAGSSYQAADDPSGGEHPERDGVDPTYHGGQGDDPPPMFTLDDAKENFPLIVKTFFHKEGDENGIWTFEGRGKPRRFALISADAKRVRGVGPGLYSGPALLRDMATKTPVVAQFIVDFSGNDWKVVGAKVAPPPVSSPPSSMPPAKAPAQR